jgi:hypothetical protein
MTTERHISDFGPREKSFDSAGLPRDSLGQSYPHRYPHPHDDDLSAGIQRLDDPLGQALTIREVATLLGCSPWTVRHSYLPKGLPHLRLGPLGKLTFYRTQVVRWILERQKKGGT